MKVLFLTFGLVQVGLLIVQLAFILDDQIVDKTVETVKIQFGLATRRTIRWSNVGNMTKSLCFYLVRHAESDNNAKGAHDARVAEGEAKSPDSKKQKVHFTREKRSISKTLANIFSGSLLAGAAALGR